jgi:hypothetical protein
MERGSLIFMMRNDPLLNALVQDRPFFGGFLLQSELFESFRVDHVRSNLRCFQAHAYMDLSANDGLDRLLGGRIRSVSDLSNAELALHALLLHEHSDVMLPSCLVRDEGVPRFATVRPLRGQVTADVMHGCGARDLIFAAEICDGQEQVLVDSTLSHSPLRSCRYRATVVENFESNPHYADDLLVHPLRLEGYGYFGDPCVDQAMLDFGVISCLRARVSDDWRAEWDRISSRRLRIHLPPLIAIAFQRAPTREDLPRTILQLREELAEVRGELRLYDKRFREGPNPADMSQRYDFITDVFKNIVPSVFQTNVESRAQTLAYGLDLGMSVLDLVDRKRWRDVLKRIFRYDRKFFEGQSPKVVVNSTITARAMSGLLQIEGMDALCAAMLYPDEREALLKEGVGRERVARRKDEG